MFSLNRATIIGNCTRDPESRSTPTGATVTNFGVATNLSWKNPQGQRQDKVEFHNIVAWGKLGEICKQYLSKGRKVYVEGRLQTREWQGTDGARRNRTEIVAESVIILDGPRGGDREAPSGEHSGEPTLSEPEAQPAPPEAEETIKVEDIPF
jgi:single-strand DNA-binding protein